MEWRKKLFPEEAENKFMCNLEGEKCRVDTFGQKIQKGSKVRLNLSRSHADIHDAFLDGKVATVEAIYNDYEGRIYVAVSLDDDPALAMSREFQQERQYFFYPHELEALEL